MWDIAAFVSGVGAIVGAIVLYRAGQQSQKQTLRRACLAAKAEAYRDVHTAILRNMLQVHPEAVDALTAFANYCDGMARLCKKED